MLVSIVGSQGAVTATFSIIKQCQALGFVPWVKVVHTSRTIHGQIYIPEINWIMFVLSLSVTVGFQSPVEIGNAYGKLEKKSDHLISLPFGISLILECFAIVQKHPLLVSVTDTEGLSLVDCCGRYLRDLCDADHNYVDDLCHIRCVAAKRLHGCYFLPGFYFCGDSLLNVGPRQSEGGRLGGLDAGRGDHVHHVCVALWHHQELRIRPPE